MINIGDLISDESSCFALNWNRHEVTDSSELFFREVKSNNTSSGKAFV